MSVVVSRVKSSRFLHLFITLSSILALAISSTLPAQAVVPAAPTLNSASTQTTGGTQAVTVNFTKGDSSTLAGYKYSTDDGVTWKDCVNNGSNCEWNTDNRYVVIQKLSSSTSSMANGDVVAIRLKACLTNGAGSTGLLDCSAASNLLGYTVGTVSAPNISTTDTIANGASNPTVTISGSNFETTTSTSLFTFAYGTTSLTASSVTFNSATSITIAFSGTAAAGTLTITAKTTAYAPVASANSNTLSISVPATTPGTPTSVAGTMVNSSQINVSWTAPTSNGGAAISDYWVQYSSNSGSTWETFTASASTSTSRNVTGLTAATGYVFRVAAKNSVGYGSFSSSSSSVTTGSGPTVPETPTALSAGSPTTTSLDLTWSAPSNNGGASISDYWIQYSSDNGSTWDTFTATASAATSRTITGLTISTSYIFRVAAKNSIGYGPFSNSSSAASTSSAAPAPVVEKIYPPVIFKLSKVQLCSRGEEEVIIQGSNLRDATVKIDGAIVRVRGNSANTINISISDALEGLSNLTVTTSAGVATTQVNLRRVDKTAFKVFDIPYIYKGGSVSYVFEAFGENTYRVTGKLPAGLELDPLTGELHGTPTEQGKFTFVVHADGFCGNDVDVVHLDIDKEIPNAISYRIKFPKSKLTKIGARESLELKKFLEYIKEISPKNIEPIIYISGGAPEGEAEVDSEEAKARRDALCDALLNQGIFAQTVPGIFSGPEDELEIFVYWPVVR